MSKKPKKKMAKASIPTTAERAARLQRDLLGRNVRQQRAILKLQRQLSSALRRSDAQLAALADELGARINKLNAAPENFGVGH